MTKSDDKERISGQPYVVSVVRDFKMYSKCVGDNPCFDGFRKVVFDNNQENLAITKRYNSFIDSLGKDEDCWIVFCHEDWRAEEDMAAVLKHLDPGKIYGPIGVFIQHRMIRDYIVPVGKIRMCDKDGGRLIVTGRSAMKHGRVDTLDCQCVVVHSSLIRKYGLRFDENLLYDMYVEDFCATAHDRYGVFTEVYPMRCTHFSYGVLGSSFFNALAYMKGKFKSSYKGYVTTAGDKNTFGFRQDRWKLHHTRFPRIAMLLNGRVFKRNR